MIPRPEENPDPLPEAVQQAAAEWLARRDRGLSRTEQDDYLEWLRADPRHAAAVRVAAGALERMMRLHEWQPGPAAANPDLFAPAETGRRRGLSAWRRAGLAAAAALALAAGLRWSGAGGGAREVAAAEAEENRFLRVNERVALPDGSRVELRDGSDVTVRYSATERRVRLTRGEAHFTVWKEPGRPFVVEAGEVQVVAVGTSFSVRREQRDLEVLVTSGSVKLKTPEQTDALPPPVLGAGTRAWWAGAAMATVGELRQPEIQPVTPEELGRSLAWLAPRLHFDDTPLEQVVRQFNRLNRQQLVLGDRQLAGLRIGGTFRPDNVEAFVRLLEVTFQIRAERRDDHEIVLQRR